jgi:hypothetical protein
MIHTEPVTIFLGQLLLYQEQSRRLVALRDALDGQRDGQFVPVGWVRAHLNGTVGE